jgi:hypothetical protein
MECAAEQDESVDDFENVAEYSGDLLQDLWIVDRLSGPSHPV